jgi:hypothetical protein
LEFIFGSNGGITEMQGWHLTAVNSGNVALYFSASITGVLNGKKM